MYIDALRMDFSNIVFLRVETVLHSGQDVHVFHFFVSYRIYLMLLNILILSDEVYGN